MRVGIYYAISSENAIKASALNIKTRAIYGPQILNAGIHKTPKVDPIN